MALPKSGYTETSADNFIIDAGTIFTDVTYSQQDGFTGTPLGATSGGVGVNIEQSYRKIEVDGAYIMDVMGLNVMESAKCTITATLKELSAANLGIASNGVVENADSTEAPAGYKKITQKRYVLPEDYIPTVAVVGTHSGTQQPILFILDNGLVTSAVDVTMTDGSEAAVEITIQANASYEQLADDEFPWRILHPNKKTT